ncbi:hypothetical protein WCE39_06365 [Luteimonas sp. MJ174]|uniref:hypothetical protein n=1 Tax=Luteimonas sp. MJ174 TaxID=3129237 RepID=UPI0031BAF198
MAALGVAHLAQVALVPGVSLPLLGDASFTLALVDRATVASIRLAVPFGVPALFGETALLGIAALASIATLFRVTALVGQAALVRIAVVPGATPACFAATSGLALLGLTPRSLLLPDLLQARTCLGLPRLFGTALPCLRVPPFASLLLPALLLLALLLALPCLLLLMPLPLPLLLMLLLPRLCVAPLRFCLAPLLGRVVTSIRSARAVGARRPGTLVARLAVRIVRTGAGVVGALRDGIARPGTLLRVGDGWNRACGQQDGQEHGDSMQGHGGAPGVVRVHFTSPRLNAL